MKIEISFICLAIFFFGCEKDEATQPAALLTLTVESSFDTSTTDNWVIIHDEQGIPITFEPFESDNVLHIVTPLPVTGNTIGVTLLKYSDFGGKKEYMVNTYFQFEKGGQLTLNSFVHQSFPPSGTTTTGTFKVAVNSKYLLHQYSFTDKHARGVHSQYDSTDFAFMGYTRDVPSKYLLQASDELGSIRYKMLDNIKPGDSFTFSFDEFSEFDKTVEFTFPESNSVLLAQVGHEEDQSIESSSYLHHLHIPSDPDDLHSSIKAGYLNSLTKYVTSVIVSYPSYKLFYQNKGSIPEAGFPILSSANYSILSKDVRDFSAASANPFIYRTSHFSYAGPTSAAPIITWYVHSSAGSHKLQGVSQEILESHPLLELTNLKYISTSFFVESLPYEKAILPEVQKESYISRGIVVY